MRRLVIGLLLALSLAGAAPTFADVPTLPAAEAEVRRLMDRAPNDPELARERDLERACKEGAQASACVQLGTDLAERVESVRRLVLIQVNEEPLEPGLQPPTVVLQWLEAEQDRALAFFGQACTSGTGAGCLGAARMETDRAMADAVAAGQGCVINDPVCRAPVASVAQARLAMARQFARAGCDLAEASACRLLGQLLAAGDGGPADPAQAREVFAAGCTAGDGEACLRAAFSRSPEEQSQAELLQYRTFLEAGCSAGFDPACAFVVDDALRGLSGPADPGRVAALRARLCDGDMQPTCHFTAVTDMSDEIAEGPWQATACAAGSSWACLNVQMSAFPFWRSGVPPHPSALQWDPKLARTACEAGVAQACFDLARTQPRAEATASELADVRRNFERACRDDSIDEFPGACQGLADVLADGVGGPVDLQRAAALRPALCERGFATSCLRIARDKPGRETRAMLRARQAWHCEEGDVVACALLSQALGTPTPAGMTPEAVTQALAAACAEGVERDICAVGQRP